jgi:hypothetical protein
MQVKLPNLLCHTPDGLLHVLVCHCEGQHCGVHLATHETPQLLATGYQKGTGGKWYAEKPDDPSAEYNPDVDRWIVRHFKTCSRQVVDTRELQSLTVYDPVTWMGLTVHPSHILDLKTFHAWFQNGGLPKIIELNRYYSEFRDESPTDQLLREVREEWHEFGTKVLEPRGFHVNYQEPFAVGPIPIDECELHESEVPQECYEALKH